MQPHSQELGAGGAGGGRVEITEDYRRFDSMGAVRGHVQSPKGTVPQSGEEALSTAGLGAAWEPWPGLSAGSGPLSGGIPHACASLTAERCSDWHCLSKSCLMKPQSSRLLATPAGGQGASVLGLDLGTSQLGAREGAFPAAPCLSPAAVQPRACPRAASFGPAPALYTLRPP